ncbi:MAG TPA: response regulator transcription factor [Pyrinomonadaceae bacterium]|nr:response regulator transcription factor [Pyrinomonadaceae bacterium]
MPSELTQYGLRRARILLADDCKEIRERAVSLLLSEFEVCGEVGDGCELLQAELELHPDVTVVDISMPGICGLDAAARLKARGSRSRILVLTVYDDPDFLRAAFASGVTGYILKSRMASDLCRAIREALAGRCFVSPSPKLSAEVVGRQ